MREGDTSKFQTLGPYSYALSKILNSSNTPESDSERFQKDGVILYRGAVHTYKEYGELIDKTGFKVPWLSKDPFIWNFPWNQLQLFGFISTSESKSKAHDFAEKNIDKRLVRAVYKIHFKSDKGKYFELDIGNHTHEKEILLCDGTNFVV